MKISKGNVGLAILGGCSAGVAVGLVARYTPALAVSQGETERGATGRLLTRSGAAIMIASLGAYLLRFSSPLGVGPSPSWEPVCLGAIGAGSLLLVSGVTMSDEKLNPAFPK